MTRYTLPPIRAAPKRKAHLFLKKTKHYQERNRASLRSTGVIFGVFLFRWA